VRVPFDRSELYRLATVTGVVAGLHVGGFGLFAFYNEQSRYQDLAGADSGLVYASAAAIAYMLGVRHAFDADHIAAIDDTTRYLLQKGQRPVGVGLAFSLGHSTVVLALSAGVAIAAQQATRMGDGLLQSGAVGTAISGAFLYAIAGLNLVILLAILRLWRRAKSGRYEPEQLNALLRGRGLLNRVFRGRYHRLINHSWQLYFVGLLFGLGFDTATQVGALGLAVGAAGGGQLPPLAIMALPLIFAAGMSLCDTLDGVLMCKVYAWSLTNPLRKIHYNIATTSLSVFVALVVGTLELVGLFAERAGMADNEPWRSITGIDLNRIGIGIALMFVLTWLVCVAVWRWRQKRVDPDRVR